MGDVAALSPFVAAAQQDDEFAAALAEIDAVAWTIVDPQSRDALAFIFDISKIAVRCPQEPVVDLRHRPPVAQGRKKLGKVRSLKDAKLLSYVEDIWKGVKDFHD